MPGRMLLSSTTPHDGQAGSCAGLTESSVWLDLLLSVVGACSISGTGVCSLLMLNLFFSVSDCQFFL